METEKIFLFLNINRYIYIFFFGIKKLKMAQEVKLTIEKEVATERKKKSTIIVIKI